MSSLSSTPLLLNGALERLRATPVTSEETHQARSNSFTTWNLAAIPKALASEYQRVQEVQSSGSAEGAGDKRGRTATYDPWRDIYSKGDFEDGKAKPVVHHKQDRVSKSKSSLSRDYSRSDDVYYNDDEYYDLANQEYEYIDGDDIAAAKVGTDYQNEEEDYAYDPLLPRRRFSNNGQWRKEETRRVAENKQKYGPQRNPYDYYDPEKVAANEGTASGPGSSSSLVPASSVSSVGHNKQSLTRRVAARIFSPTVLTIAAVLGVPLVLGLAYFLFVLNGPTPVVRAREETEEWFTRIMEVLNK